MSWGGARLLTVLCGVALVVSGRSRGEVRVPQSRELPRVLAPLVRPRDVVASRLFVGHRVRVAGRCVPGGVRGGAGTPRAWQVADEGAVVAVVGPMPRDCHLGARVVVEGVVEEDVLPKLGQLPAARRRYLRVDGRAPPPAPVPRAARLALALGAGAGDRGRGRVGPAA